MIKLVILVLILGTLNGFSQEVQIETRFSQPFAVFQFMNSLSARAPGNVYKRLFNRSNFAARPYTDMIIQFDSLNLNYNFDFPDYPAGQKIGIDISNFLKRNLILSAGTQDFKLRSMGLVPNEALIKLEGLLKEFTPVYEEVIYKPSKTRFDVQLKGVSELIKASNINYYFTEALHFYNSSWDFSVPIIFCFYPLPYSKGFSATAFSNIAISAIADSLDNYKALLAVMMHEVSHILFDERSLTLWSRLDDWFTSNPSRVSRYAYSLFNESMATAVANGYIGSQLNGKEDTVRRWYGVKYINLMAKTAYPVVKEYMVDHKPMDRELVDRYIRLFEERFSGWLSDPEYLMMSRIVLSENPADFNLLDTQFPFSPEHEYHPKISESLLKGLKNNHGTKIIIVNNDHKEKLDLVRRNVEELEGWNYDANTDFLHATFLKDKTWLIIMNNVKGTTAEKLRGLVVREGN